MCVLSLKFISQFFLIYQHKTSPEQATKHSNDISSTKTTPVKSKPTSQKSPDIIPSSTEEQSAVSTATPAASPGEKKKRVRRVRVQTTPMSSNGDTDNTVSRKKRGTVSEAAKGDGEKAEKRVRKTPKKFENSDKEKTVIRRVRCHACEGCSRDNCNECRYCLDMKKNGGEGKLRQSCAMRFCEDVSLLVFTNIFPQY